MRRSAWALRQFSAWPRWMRFEIDPRRTPQLYGRRCPTRDGSVRCQTAAGRTTSTSSGRQRSKLPVHWRTASTPGEFFYYIVEQVSVELEPFVSQSCLRWVSRPRTPVVGLSRQVRGQRYKSRRTRWCKSEPSRSQPAEACPLPQQISREPKRTLGTKLSNLRGVCERTSSSLSMLRRPICKRFMWLYS